MSDRKGQYGRQRQGKQRCADGVKQAFFDQHGAKLTVRHANGLQHGKFMLSCQDAGLDRIDKVQCADQRNDCAQEAAADYEEMLEAVE